MTPIQASEKVNEEAVFSNFQDNGQKRQPEDNPEDLIRTADKKKFE